jgi:hypothetical protein
MFSKLPKQVDVSFTFASGNRKRCEYLQNCKGLIVVGFSCSFSSLRILLPLIQLSLSVNMFAAGCPNISFSSTLRCCRRENSKNFGRGEVSNLVLTGSEFHWVAEKLPSCLQQASNVFQHASA